MVSVMGLWEWLTGRRRTEPPAPAPTPRPTPRPSPRQPAQRPPAELDAPTISRREYLSPEDEARSFTLGPDGMPTGRLRRERDRLTIFTDDGAGMVNPASRSMHRLGLYCVRVRGVTFHEDAVSAGDYRPGRRVRLVREPDNEHDPHAIAVYALEAEKPAGYVNKQNARRIAPRLDAGEPLEAISLRGNSPGVHGPAPWILVATPDVLRHLRRGA